MVAAAWCFKFCLVDFTNIEAKIDSCKEDLEQKIGNIEQQLSVLRTECKAEIKNVSDSVTVVRDDLELTRRNVHRSGTINELIVSGIPYTSDENLLEIFLNISKALSYNSSEVPMVYLKRLSKLPIKAGSAPPILCQFSLRGVRDEFYARYLQLRTLNLCHVGFNNQNRVYINENLAREDREIRTQAIKLKKQGRIQQAFTRNGIVFIRVKNGDDAVPYYTLEQLFASVNQPIQ
ncbi:AAEL004550-PA [Aedes aegypti]|uniref:AAEL004550-PA n=1 Tax=Aedes aegypti TaxID=7159 RepID=Q17CI3_AEDAE|nr:AAEL004550-PA [Aedes aegypti]